MYLNLDILYLIKNFYCYRNLYNFYATDNYRYEKKICEFYGLKPIDYKKFFYTK